MKITVQIDELPSVDIKDTPWAAYADELEAMGMRKEDGRLVSCEQREQDILEWAYPADKPPFDDVEIGRGRMTIYADSNGMCESDRLAAGILKTDREIEEDTRSILEWCAQQKSDALAEIRNAIAEMPFEKRHIDRVKLFAPNWTERRSKSMSEDVKAASRFVHMLSDYGLCADEITEEAQEIWPSIGINTVIVTPSAIVIDVRDFNPPEAPHAPC